MLRHFRDEDLDSLCLLFSDPEVMAQTFRGKPFSKEECVEFSRDFFDYGGNKTQKTGVLVLRATEEIVGIAGLSVCHALGDEDYELGFILARHCWGKGYATEIGQAQVEYGLGKLGCKRLLALVAPGNLPSASVLRKIGMIYHSRINMEQRGERDVYLISSAT